MVAELPEATQRLLGAMPDLTATVRFFPQGTKTADDAARAIGCPVSAIVKSLVFVVVSGDGDEPVVGLVPGDLRLDTAKLATVAGARSSRQASLEEVRIATGYAAGGTPPFGHTTPVRVFADHLLKRNNPVWAAGGTPSTVFPISLADLDRLAKPTWGDITVS